jgi:hypothetical protein
LSDVNGELMSQAHAQPVLTEALAKELLTNLPDVVLVVSFPDF